MIKKVSLSVSALLVVLLLVCAAAIPAFAEATDTYAITDDAAVFSADQTDKLIEELDEAGKETGWQIIVHTSNDGISSDDDLESHYNNYYDVEYNKGDFKYDALMLIIDRKSNKRDILCYGKVRDYFKDKSRYDIIKNAMRPYLTNDDMYGATLQFIDKAEEIYDLASNSSVDLQEVEDTFVTQHTTVRTIQRESSGSSGGGGSSHSGGGNSSGGF